MKINWIVQGERWAFDNLCRHMEKKMPSHQHIIDGENNDGNIKFICSPNFFRRGYKADKKTFLLLPGFRIFGDIILNKNNGQNMNTKILSAEFTSNWSWGLTFNEIKKKTDIEFDRVFYNNGDKINSTGYDMVFAQNVSLLKKFRERLRTVCRMGGNQNFDGVKKLEPLLNEMSKCYCLVATNQKLYDIASAIHDNVYLIPNGIDLTEWSALNRDARKKFTVGFCGNITTSQYREYKGYDFVEQACDNLGVQLKTALYKKEQIPHDKMREKFYSQIDCIVHPTLGEGCSNTLMEACACGVPIITTREAGFHGELMVDGKDVLFCERSIESVENAIARLKKDKKLRKRLSKGARKFAEKHHNVNIIVKQYEKIFTACVKKAKTVCPSVKFYCIRRNGSRSLALYSINGGKVCSKNFPFEYTKDQIRANIIGKYLNEAVA